MSRLVLNLYELMENSDLVESELLQLRAKVHVLERERDFWKDFAEQQRLLLESKIQHEGVR